MCRCSTPLSFNEVLGDDTAVGANPALLLDAGNFERGEIADRRRMLEKIGAELTRAGPAEARCLRYRAELILDLLTPQGRFADPVVS